MKTVIISLLAFLVFSPSFSQETSSDAELKQEIVGTWQHVSSTDYKGNIIRYESKIQLLSDGTGICTKHVDGQKIDIPFFWDIAEGAITLYILNKKGKRINTDKQFIRDVNEQSMNLACLWASDEFLGRSSFYKRMIEGEAKF